MTPNKKQSKFTINNLACLIFLFTSQNFLIRNQSFAQESYKLNEIEIDRNINYEDEDNFDLPNNPFDIIDRIQRANSMNDATKPSDAIDDAIKFFDMIIENEQI